MAEERYESASHVDLQDNEDPTSVVSSLRGERYTCRTEEVLGESYGKAWIWLICYDMQP